MNWYLQDSAAPEGKSEISIEKLETQLNTLKTMFAEKQKLVADLEAYGAGGGAPSGNIMIGRHLSRHISFKRESESLW